MWNLDAETLIQILVFVVIVGGAILRFVYQAFIKPLQEAQARRRAMQPGQEPAQTLRDFLAEIRGEKPEGGGAEEPAASPREAHHRDLVREAVEGEPERRPSGEPRQPFPEAGPPPIPARGRGRHRRRSVRQEEEKKAAAEARAPKRALSSLAPAGEGREPVLAAQPHVEARTEGALRRAKELRDAAGPLHLGRLPPGMSLRDVVLAQVILGPPLCRQKPSQRRQRR